MKIALAVCLSVCIGLVHGFEDKTVYQCLVDNGYNSFARLLRESNLVNTLNAGGPFTVFAPTDAALGKLDPDLMVSLGHNPVQLKSLLQYHITNGFILIPQLARLNLTSLEGQTIMASGVGSNIQLNNVSRISKGDNICNNGVVHGIDTVLLPPVFGTNNIAQVIVMQDYRFKEFFNFLLLTNLTTLLESDEYTLFAPQDAAWAKYLDRILHPQTHHVAHLYIEMLKYHLIPGARTLSILKDGQQLYTLHGYPVNITINAAGAMVNQAHIVESNIPASNGVIHVLDDVLFPQDLLEELIRENQQTHPGDR